MTPLRDFDRLRFGHFEVDLGSGELFRNGRRIALQELPFQLLTALIASPGQLLKREELIARFWPGSALSDDDSLNTAVRKIRLSLSDNAKTPRYIETVGRRGYRFIMPVRPVERGQVLRRLSIGVLAIEELAQDAERNFTHGLIEEIIARLCVAHPLIRIVTLSPRTSVDEIDERSQLQRRVDYFLACSARKRESQVRLTAKLIRAADRSIRWAESFDYSAADMLSTPRDVASKISEAALRSLGLGAPPQPTINASAYEAFLKAEYLWKKRTPASLRSAHDLYKLALAQDERFHKAQIGLAQSHLMLALYELVEPRPSLEIARDLAHKLIARDPATYEAHVLLAWTEMVLDRNWQQAEANFRQALQSAPDAPYAHSGYAYLLFVQGRREESQIHLRHALGLEPLSSPLLMREGVFRLLKQDYLGAEESLQRSLELEPNYEPSLAYLGITYSLLGEFDKALAAARRALIGDSAFALPIAFHAFVASAAGNTQEARDAVASLWSMRKRCHVSGYALAVGYLALKDTARAMEELERADQERSSTVLLTPWDPLLKPLHSHERFPALIDRLGLSRASPPVV